MSDGSIVIDVLLDDGQVVKGVASLDGKFKGLEDSAKKGALGIKKIVTALGLMALAAKGISMIKKGIEGAFARIDTMERFERVMTVMTGSSQKAAKALEEAREVVKGTAYGLDVAAKGVQDFVTRGVSVDKATERLKAWGDAVAFYGNGSNEQLGNVMDALAKMTTSGKVGMDQMDRLFDAGIDAVGMYAKATGQNADVVQKSLSKGNITAEQFIDVVTKAMMEGTNGVQKIAGAAKEAGASWTGTFDNMQAAVNRGVVNIIQTIDKMLTENGLPDMRSMVKEFGTRFEEALNKVAKFIPKVVDGMKQLRTNIDNLLTSKGLPTMGESVGIISEKFREMISFITGSVPNAIGKLRDSWSGVSEKALSVFKTIKTFIVSLMGDVVSFLREKLATLLTFWEENGDQIIKAVQNAFKMILSIIEFIMPAVLFIIDMVWTAIKQVITGALNVIMGLVKIFTGLFTGDFSKMWEGVKQLFFGAIDLIIGWLSLTFVGGIRTMLAKLSTKSIGIIKNMWTSIVNFFKSFADDAAGKVASMASKVWSFARKLASDFKNTILKLRDDVIKKFQDLKDGVIKKVKSIDLTKIGKDIIHGLINGIGSMASAVWEKAKSIAQGVADSIKDVLGIHSPSRVAKQLGEWFGIGLAQGIDKSRQINEKAVQGLANVIKNTTQAMNKEINAISKKQASEEKAIIQKKTKDIANIYAVARSKKRNLTLAEKQRIQKIEEDAAKKLTVTAAKYAQDRNKIEQGLAKNRLEAIKLYIEDKNSLDQLSLVAEAKIWEKSVSLFKNGTKEKVEAQQAYQKALKAVNDELVRVNEEYAGKMSQISENLKQQEKELTETYESTLNDRANSLRNFAGLFDEVDLTVQKSGTELLKNLQDQVSAFAMWQGQIDLLATKAIDGGLLAELREMGPKALPELIALNSMTDSQLSQYSALYVAKSKLARQQAEKELAGMKADTQKRINELRNTANAELEKLRAEWASKIVSITRTTDNELKSLKQIGENAGKGLLDGLTSMEPALVARAKSIAESIKAVMKSALDIHSPSRWMRDMIGKNMMLGWIQGMDRQKSAVLQKAKQAAEWMKPDVPQVGGFVNKLRGVTAPIGNLTPFSKMTAGSSTVSNNNSKTFAPQIVNHFTPAESTPSEQARKQEQFLRKLGMEF